MHSRWQAALSLVAQPALTNVVTTALSLVVQPASPLVVASFVAAQAATMEVCLEEADLIR